MEEIRLLIQKKIAHLKLQDYIFVRDFSGCSSRHGKGTRNLKDYALENSTMAEENFISGSLKLNEIRDEKRKVEEISKLLSILGSLIRSGNLDMPYDASDQVTP